MSIFRRMARSEVALNGLIPSHDDSGIISISSIIVMDHSLMMTTLLECFICRYKHEIKVEDVAIVRNDGF